MRIFTVLIIFLSYTLSSIAQQVKPIIFGEQFILNSIVLKESRTINVYLPQNYNLLDTIKHPVIYIMDGGVEEDFFHVAGIVRFNNQPWINRFPSSIVVGIENTNRRRDATFAVANLDFLSKMGFKEEQFPEFGGAENYIAFLKEELQPYIQANYNANEHQTLIGESLAGLLTTEVLLRHPELFDDYIIISPSLWWGSEQEWRKRFDAFVPPSSHPLKVYIAASNRAEGEYMYELAVRLKNEITRKNSPQLQLYFDYLHDENHATIMHHAVYNAFKVMYPDTLYRH